MNENVCDFVVQLLDMAHAPGNVPSRPASTYKGGLIRKRSLSHQACYYHEHTREGNRTVQIAARPHSLAADGFVLDILDSISRVSPGTCRFRIDCFPI
jgi:hypothetical protein